LLESIPIFERLGDQHNAYHFTVLLAGVERDRGNFERSQHLLEDCISEFRTTDCAEGMATTLYRFSLLARDRSDTRQAIEQAVESASCYLKLGMRADLASGLELLAGLACDQKEPECAVRLFSAASTIREDLDVPVPPVQRAARDQDLASARTALIAGQFASAWTVGRAMPLEQQLEHAASALVPTNAPPTPHLPQNVLTRREREVAMLIARGYTNRQIAQELVISERTADGHVANILAKLGLQTRVQAAVWVVEHQLATRSP
jgi:DNA-binding NarL/FixJ family response regulator